jgi:hypothetical protein
MVERVLGCMRTADGLWRVQVIRARGRQWYRLFYGERLYQDGLVIGTVQHFLQINGVDWADLVEDAA